MHWFPTTMALADGDGLGEIVRVAMAHEGKIIPFSSCADARTLIRRVRVSPDDGNVQAHDAVADEWFSLRPPTIVRNDADAAVPYPQIRAMLSRAPDGPNGRMLILDFGCVEA